MPRGRVAPGRRVATQRIAPDRIPAHAVAPDRVAACTDVRTVVAVRSQHLRQHRRIAPRRRRRWRRHGGRREADVKRRQQRLETGRAEVLLVAEALDGAQGALADDSVGCPGAALRTSERLLQLERLLGRKSVIDASYAKALARRTEIRLAPGLSPNPPRRVLRGRPRRVATTRRVGLCRNDNGPRSEHRDRQKHGHHT